MPKRNFSCLAPPLALPEAADSHFELFALLSKLNHAGGGTGGRRLEFFGCTLIWPSFSMMA
jgi:hypothetical protein